MIIFSNNPNFVMIFKINPNSVIYNTFLDQP